MYLYLELELEGIKLKQFLIAQQNQVPRTQTTLKENKYHLSHNKIYSIFINIVCFLKGNNQKKRLYP